MLELFLDFFLDAFIDCVAVESVCGLLSEYKGPSSSFGSNKLPLSGRDLIKF